MTAFDILRASGIEFALRDGRVVFRPDPFASPEVREVVRANADEIRAYLAEHGHVIAEQLRTELPRSA